MSLIIQAKKINDYATAKAYAPPLLNFQQYAMQALVVLIDIAIKEDDKASAHDLLLRAEGEIKATGSLKISEQQIESVATAYFIIGEQKKLDALLEQVKNKYSESPWYTRFSQPSQKSEKSVEQPSLDVTGQGRVVSNNRFRKENSSENPKSA